MPWFRLDEGGHSHPKVISAGNEAYGVWCRAGQWSNQYLTDGRIPTDVAHAWAPPEVWQRLIDARCGHEHGLVVIVDGGYQIHDFNDYQPLAKEVRAKRDSVSSSRRLAGKRGGLNSGRARRSKTEREAKERDSSDDEAKLKQMPSSDPGSGPLETRLESITKADTSPPKPALDSLCGGDETPPTSRSRRGDVDVVMDRWMAAPYHQRRPKATTARRNRIEKRLSEGFTAEELMAAVDGAQHDDWLMGRDPKSPKAYRDLDTILRDAGQVERLRDLNAASQPVTDAADIVWARGFCSSHRDDPIVQRLVREKRPPMLRELAAMRNGPTVANGAPRRYGGHIVQPAAPPGEQCWEVDDGTELHP